MHKISSPPVEEIFSALNSSPSGLSNTEAAQRLIEQNKHRKKQSRFQRELKLFIRQFTNPLMLLLLAAVILSGFIGETSDMIIILSILLASGLLSFFQELNAGRAVEKLQQMIQATATVLREGKPIDIKTNEVVVGDVLLFNAGDIAPADCRIIETHQLQVNEAALTGESFPVEKQISTIDEKAPTSEKINCLWKGTNVISGTASAIAVNLGSDTMFGKMQKSLERDTETVFEKGIKGFGYFLLIITIVLSIAVLGVNLYFKKPVFDSILFSLAIAVGMAPELLPAIMTLSMTAGAKRMLKKKVIVKKLSSIFNFGEVNVLCVDKTGTITEGAVVLKKIVNAEGQEDDNLKLCAYLNAHFQAGFSNPIDAAIRILNIDVSGFQKVDELPYDFNRKRLSVLVKNNQQELLVTKGAFSNVISVCSKVETNNNSEQIDASKKEQLEKTFMQFSADGFRVLGLAKKELQSQQISISDEKEMTFLGYILLEDPLKEGVGQSIEKLKQLNVGIRIITGDNRHIAAYVARELNLDDKSIISGDMLSSMNEEELLTKVMQTNIFAEIEPDQKENIIKFLQKAGQAVAYMGDGINDVAAIHAADTGISVEDAVDVAKESADFVLLEKDIGVLADGIFEGRRSFVNSMKYIFITTGATFGNMFSVAGASLILPFLPMLPKQILLTNFLTDFPFLAVSSDNIDEEQITHPRKWDIKLIRSFMLVFGIHSSLFDFLTFYLMYFYFRLSESAFQTSWFIESVMTELLILFIIRTRRSVLKSRPGTMLMLIGAVAIVITALLPVSPLAPLLGFSIAHTKQVIAVLLILVLYVITADILKIFFFRRLKAE